MSRTLVNSMRGVLRRLVGPSSPQIAPRSRCRVKHSLVTQEGGILLRDSKVEVTGVQDPQGRYQVRVMDIPDYQWTETRRLPYGPNFILYVDEATLEVLP